jgi:hypothetical protein
MQYASVTAGMGLIVAACGSAAPAIHDAPSPGSSVTMTSTGAEVVLARESFVREETVEAPASDVWRVLAQAWEDASVPIESVDNARRALSSGVYRPPARIVGRPLSDFFDCGYSMGGPRVTLWQVSIDVAGAVLPDPAGAKVATRVGASARPRDGTSTNAVMCTSRGELERIIAGNVRVRLGK